MAERGERLVRPALLTVAALLLRDADLPASDDALRIDLLGDSAVHLRLRRRGMTLREVLVLPGRTHIEGVPPHGASAHADAGEDVVWPRSIAVAPGVRVELRVEPLRRVLLRVAGGDLGDRPLLRFVPDRRVRPPSPPDRLDALQAWVDTHTAPVIRLGRGTAELRAPRVDGWVFGRVRGRPVARAVGRDDTECLLDPADLRPLSVPPAVAGRAVPPGTLVAPGRLDLAAAAAVRTMLELHEFPGAVVVGDEPWRPVEVPRADSLTLQHPLRGVAYARWTDGVPDDGVAETRTVLLSLADGRPFTGHVALWPAWTEGRSVFSRPSDRHLRRAAVGGASVLLRCLPPGIYRYDYAVAAEGARPGGVLRRGSVDLRDDVPVRRVVLEPDR